MATLSARQVVQAARRAGYLIAGVEQLRPSRWLLTLTDATGAEIVLLVQARPLIISADVLDLAEIVRVRRPTRGILWAYDGSFSPDAHRTLEELADERLRLHDAATSGGASIRRSLAGGSDTGAELLVRPRGLTGSSPVRCIYLTKRSSARGFWYMPRSKEARVRSGMRRTTMQKVQAA